MEGAQPMHHRIYHHPPLLRSGQMRGFISGLALYLFLLGGGGDRQRSLI